MKVINLISTCFLSTIGMLNPILDWIFKDKSLNEIRFENSISEDEDKYNEAISDIRNGKKNRVNITLKNGDTLEVKSIK